MAAKLFQNLLVKNVKEGKGPSRSKQSIRWFKDSIVKISAKRSGSGVVESESATKVRSWTNVGPGQMYFVHYDPKHKDTLKYYDSFPLIIPIERYPDGILALNLHYLPPMLRAKLLDALMETASNKNLDEKTKMKINYNMLASVAKSKYYKPCIKRYLGKHFTTEFVKIHPSAWESAIYMPVESFKKATKAQVWSDSRRVK